MKKNLTLLITLIVLLDSTHCVKETSDFRSKYLGKFHFKVVTARWLLNAPWEYDTTFYDGVIRVFETIDSEEDCYVDDDSEENPNEKITIEFLENAKITSLIDKQGTLTPKAGYHYYHCGWFTHIDTIRFSVTGLGGLGGGWNWEVRGVRRE